ncbi:hypothetical protein WJX84_011372, partial [Apatococcus fuscideae]
MPIDDTIFFYVNGRECRAGQQYSKLSLNEYLLQQTRWKGTKLSCGEGGFHLVQEQIAANNGSQRGFCTPGMVMAIDAQLKRCAQAHHPPDVQALQAGLDGNLCRCTGYRSIIDTCRAVSDCLDVEDLGCGQACSKDSVSFPPALKKHIQGTLEWGACVTLEEVIDSLKALKENAGFYTPMIAHLQRIAGTHVRAAATIGGNIVLTQQKGLQSDFCTIMLAAGAQVLIWGKQHRRVASHHDFAICSNPTRWLPLGEILQLDCDLDFGKASLITAIRMPLAQPDESFASFKVAARYTNAHAIVNLSVRFSAPEPTTLHAASFPEMRIALGYPHPDKLVPEGAFWRAQRARKTEDYLTGLPMEARTMSEALSTLTSEMQPASCEGTSADGHCSIAEGLLFQAIAPMVPIPCSGHQSIPEMGQLAPPAHLPIEKERARLQASGEAKYTGSYGYGNSLHAYPVLSTRALATVESLDASAALAVEGVVGFYTAGDIPGANFCNGIPFLADGRVEHYAQPIAFVVATLPSIAEHAAGLVEVEYGDAGHAILTIAQARASSSFLQLPGPPEDGPGASSSNGDVAAALRDAPLAIRDAKWHIPSQLHMYMETPVAVVEPDEGGMLSVHAAAQGIDSCQSTVARVMGMPCNHVRVVTRRLGGGFGGKLNTGCADQGFHFPNDSFGSSFLAKEYTQLRCWFDGSVQSKTALVTIYGDGSVMLSHGGLEMGQGLSTKVLQVAAYELGKLLPDHQKPLPLSLFQANDVTSDSQPNN